MRRIFRLLVLASAVMVAGVRLPAQAPAEAGVRLPEEIYPGLKPLLDQALRQSPRMIARNTEEVVAEANRLERRAGELPSVSGYARYYPWTREDRRDLPQATTSQKTAYSLAVTQPVFHWGALRDNARIGELQLQITRGQTADTYRALVGEIRGQYLQLITRKLGLARTRFAARIAEAQFALAKTKFEARTISADEMFNATMSIEQSRLSLDRAEDDYANALRLFGRLCGTGPFPDEQVPAEIPAVDDAAAVVERVTSEFTAGGEPDTYGLRALRDQLAIERLTYDIASKRLRPKFNVVAGTSQDEQSYTANIGQRYGVQSIYTGAEMSWSIFDGFAARSAKISSLARRRQLERAYKDAAAETVVGVKAQQKQIGFAARSLAMAEQYYRRSVEARQRREDDLKRGLISQADFDGSQLGFLDSQIGIYSARAEYLMRITELLSTTLKDPALSTLPARP